MKKNIDVRAMLKQTMLITLPLFRLMMIAFYCKKKKEKFVNINSCHIYIYIYIYISFIVEIQKKLEEVKSKGLYLKNMVLPCE